jgi:hypothetical protein
MRSRAHIETAVSASVATAMTVAHGMDFMGFRSW